jgi:hypothetical protein
MELVPKRLHQENDASPHNNLPRLLRLYVAPLDLDLWSSIVFECQLRIGSTNHRLLYICLRSPTWNCRSERFLLAWIFIRFWAVAKCCFKSVNLDYLFWSICSASEVPLLGNIGKMLFTGGSYPYRAMNGGHPSEVWKLELYHNLANASQDFHYFGELCTTHLKYISTHWWTFSVCPSVWGW